MQGPRSSGSIGDVVKRISFKDGFLDELYFYRYWYDLSAFVIVNVVFLNIIFGIIINSFKCRLALPAIRLERRELLDLLKNTCFVCSLHRDEVRLAYCSSEKTPRPSRRTSRKSTVPGTTWRTLTRSKRKTPQVSRGSSHM